MERKRIKNRIAAWAVAASCLLGSSGFTQDEKQVDKAWKVFYNKSTFDGRDLLLKYIRKANDGSGASYYGYDSWVKMEMYIYSSFETLEIEIEPDENGDVDSSAYFEIEELKESYKTRFLNACRKSTLESSSYTGEICLRNYLVDYDPDTAVSEKAKSYFEEGEEFFEKEDFELAELNYRKALNEDSTYYSALLYLGDTFWAREDYDSAIVYFTMAKEMHPDLLEPRNYIVDALIKQGLYYRAKKECLEAMCVYAGIDVKWRLYQILEQENKALDDHRFLRFYYPNNMTEDDQSELFGVLAPYREAKEEIGKYTNEDGIIEPNGITTDKYLEVYSYRKLLEENESNLPSVFDFAYKAMEDGYLDCFVFISLFHVDIYPQFKDFMSSEENRKRSLDYIEKYLIVSNSSKE